jgi:hypothetical protein
MHFTQLQRAGWQNHVVAKAMRAGLSERSLLLLASEFGPWVVRPAERMIGMLLEAEEAQAALCREAAEQRQAEHCREAAPALAPPKEE